MVGSTVLDRVETRFGVRDIEWKPGSGMWLNGKNIKLQGVCQHQHAGALGAAVPEKIIRFRVEQMKAMAVEQGLDGFKLINFGGAAMNACWVIENAPAVYFKLPKPEEGGGALWDFAASACLFAELDGAVVSDFSGAPLRLNRQGDPYMNREGVVFASSEALWRAGRGLSQ